LRHHRSLNSEAWQHLIAVELNPEVDSRVGPVRVFVEVIAVGGAVRFFDNRTIQGISEKQLRRL